MGKAKVPKRAANLGDADKLWEVSAELTKTAWPTVGINMVGMEDDARGGGEHMDNIEL